jgi:hypothetical protein
VSRKFSEAVKEMPYIISSSKYKSHIHRWERYFDRSSIIILNFKNIKRNPKKLLERLYSFIKVNDEGIPDSAYEVHNEYRLPRSIYLSRAVDIVVKALHSINGQSLIEFAKTIGIQNVLYTKNKKDSFDVEDEIIEKLRNLFAEDKKYVKNRLPYQYI